MTNRMRANIATSRRNARPQWKLPATVDVYLGVTADGDSLGVGAAPQDGAPVTAEWLARLDEANPSGAPHRIVRCTETTFRTPWEIVPVEGGDGDA